MELPKSATINKKKIIFSGSNLSLNQSVLPGQERLIFRIDFSFLSDRKAACHYTSDLLAGKLGHGWRIAMRMVLIQKNYQGKATRCSPLPLGAIEQLSQTIFFGAEFGVGPRALYESYIISIRLQGG